MWQLPLLPSSRLENCAAHFKSSPDKYKHMQPSMLRCIQRCVKSARDQLTEQQLDTSAIPESLGDLIEWCKENDFFVALKPHGDPNNPYCIQLYKAFVRLEWTLSQSTKSSCLNRNFPGESQKLSSARTASVWRSTMLYNAIPTAPN